MRQAKKKMTGPGLVLPNRPAQSRQQRRRRSARSEDTPPTPPASEAPDPSQLQDEDENEPVCPCCWDKAVDRAGNDLLLELLARACDEPTLTPEMEALLAVGGHVAHEVLGGRSARATSGLRHFFNEALGTAAPLKLYLAEMHAFYDSPLIRPLLEILVRHRVELSVGTPEHGFPWSALVQGAHLDATRSLLQAVGGGRVN